jgi:hypothetical protein
LGIGRLPRRGSRLLRASVLLLAVLPTSWALAGSPASGSEPIAPDVRAADAQRSLARWVRDDGLARELFGADTERVYAAIDAQIRDALERAAQPPPSRRGAEEGSRSDVPAPRHGAGGDFLRRLVVAAFDWLAGPAAAAAEEQAEQTAIHEQQTEKAVIRGRTTIVWNEKREIAGYGAILHVDVHPKDPAVDVSYRESWETAIDFPSPCPDADGVVRAEGQLRIRKEVRVGGRVGVVELEFDGTVTAQVDDRAEIAGYEMVVRASRTDESESERTTLAGVGSRTSIGPDGSGGSHHFKFPSVPPTQADQARVSGLQAMLVLLTDPSSAWGWEFQFARARHAWRGMEDERGWGVLAEHGGILGGGSCVEVVFLDGHRKTKLRRGEPVRLVAEARGGQEKQPLAVDLDAFTSGRSITPEVAHPPPPGSFAYVFDPGAYKSSTVWVQTVSRYGIGQADVTFALAELSLRVTERWDRHDPSYDGTASTEVVLPIAPGDDGAFKAEGRSTLTIRTSVHVKSRKVDHSEDFEVQWTATGKLGSNGAIHVQLSNLRHKVGVGGDCSPCDAAARRSVGKPVPGYPVDVELPVTDGATRRIDLGSSRFVEVTVVGAD